MAKLSDPAVEDELYGSDEVCHGNPSGHEPDWRTITTEWDGDTLYLDVACKHCGRSGCIGTVNAIAKEISW